MKITIQLDDGVAERYASRLRPKQTLEQILAVQLMRFAAIDPRDRVLIILPEERHRLEELTTRLPLISIADLTKRVADLAEISIGRIRLRFTPPQLRELQHRAKRWRMSLPEYTERIVRQIEGQFLNEVPRESILVKEPAGRELGAEPKKGGKGADQGL